MTASMIRRGVSHKFTKEAPLDQIFKGVFYLHKELGIGYEEMMGYKEHVPVSREVERGGFLGSLLDSLIGKKTVNEIHQIEHHGMPLTTYFVLIKQLQEHNKKAKEKMNKGRGGTPSHLGR